MSEVTEADLPALAALMSASPLLKRYGITIESAISSLAEGLALGDTLLVGSEGDPVGLAWLQRLRGFGGSAYLRLLLVAEGRHGRGIGSRLLQAAEQRAAPFAQHLLLLVTEDNHAARRFYERHGYSQVGNLRRLILPDADEVLYSRALYTEASHGRS